MDREAWWTTAHGIEESDMTEIKHTAQFNINSSQSNYTLIYLCLKM